MKLSKLIQVFPSMQALAQTKLPAKVGYRIAKAINLARPELETYEAQRIKLAESMGRLSEDGQHYIFEGNTSSEFSEQLIAMGDEEVALEFPTITMEELGDVKIEPMHLAALDGILIKS